MNQDSFDNGERLVPRLLTRAWKRRDQLALEYFSLQAAHSHIFLTGQISAVTEGRPCFLNYAVICSADWVTREAVVSLSAGGAHTSAKLVRTSQGDWQVNGSDRLDLAGATDIDIQWTPATNTPPVKRMQLEVGESRQVDAAWVRIPELTIERLVQVYTRTARDIYRYESGGGSFVADLKVDAEGFVDLYGDLWTCVGKDDAASWQAGERSRD